MNIKRLGIFSAAFLCLAANAFAAPQTIRPGELWPDNRGQHIQAHGGGQPAGLRVAGVPMRILLTGLPANAVLRVETLDQSHGYALAAWQAMGSPEPPTREQAAQLRQAAAATKTETLQADGNGKFLLQRELAPWSVVLIEQP